MVLKKYFFLLIIILIPMSAWANFRIEDYKFFKKIQGSGIIDNRSYLKIDDEIYKGSELFLTDLKIIEDNKKEFNYMIAFDQDIVNHKKSIQDLNIIKKTISKKGKNIEYILDVGDENNYHNKIKIISSSQEFDSTVSIFGAKNLSGKFIDINLDKKHLDKISNLPGQQDFLIEYKFNNYRYLKLIINTKNGELKLDKFRQIFDKTDVKKGERKIIDIPVETILSQDNQDFADIFILDTGRDKFLREKVNLNFTEGLFSKKYTLYDSNNKKEWQEISVGQLIRSSFQDKININLNSKKRFYKLIIKDDKVKNRVRLHLISASLESFVQKIYILGLLDFTKHNYKLYYGSNKVTNHTEKKVNIKLDKQYKFLQLSQEFKNDKFQKKEKINVFNVFLINNWHYFLEALILIFLVLFVRIIFIEKKDKDFEPEDKKFVSKL